MFTRLPGLQGEPDVRSGQRQVCRRLRLTALWLCIAAMILAIALAGLPGRGPGLPVVQAAAPDSAQAGLIRVEPFVAAPDAPHAPILNTTAEDFKLPGTQPGGLTAALASSGTCTGCHVNHIVSNYAGSMMANSVRDPLFRAALRVANEDANFGGELCIRCHAPNAWLNGRSTPTDGSAFIASDLQGVSCNFCHRLVPNTATQAGNVQRDLDELAFIKGPQSQPLVLGSAAYIVDRQDFRRGPYNVAAPHATVETTWNRTGYFCATCHEIDNPLLAYDETTNEFVLNPLNQPTVVGAKLFPIERTFSEWFYSDFNPERNPNGVAEVSGIYPGLKRSTGTANGPVTVCQDCHMEMIESPASTLGTPERQIGKHEWIGGSSVWQIGIADYWEDVAADTLFNKAQTEAAAAKGELMLQRAVSMTLEVNQDQLAVTLINNTGHKLPTGYAEGRRMWLQVKAYIEGTEVYTSGVPTASGGIYDKDSAKIYEVKLGISENHAATLNRPDLAGEGFHFILNNKVFKDNRIPPRGFTNELYAIKTMEPVGYSYEDGQYWDTTYYTLPEGTDKVEVTLFYQTASDEYLDFLTAEAGGPEDAVPDAVVGQPVNWGQVVNTLRHTHNLDQPVVVVSDTIEISGGVQLPPRTFIPLLPNQSGE